MICNKVFDTRTPNILLVEIHHRLCHIYGAKVVVSLHAVEWWHKKFPNGSIDDAAQSSRPSETINKMVHCVHSLLEEDRLYTITDLQVQITSQYAYDIDYSTIYTALREHLQMSKVCARWVPRQLTETNQKLHMGRALLFQVEGNALHKHMVIRDKLWIHFWMPETKEPAIPHLFSRKNAEFWKKLVDLRIFSRIFFPKNIF